MEYWLEEQLGSTEHAYWYTMLFVMLAYICGHTDDNQYSARREAINTNQWQSW